MQQRVSGCCFDCAAVMVAGMVMAEPAAVDFYFNHDNTDSWFFPPILQISEAVQILNAAKDMMINVQCVACKYGRQGVTSGEGEINRLYEFEGNHKEKKINPANPPT